MPVGVAVVLGVLVAVAATVLAYIFVLPDSRRASLPKFFRLVADFFNFKYLVLEKVLKALYIFNTLACIGIGFCMLFSVIRYGWYGPVYIGYWGLIVMILGPVLVRLIYEGMMLIILLVKNTIELNQKFNAQPGSLAEQKREEERRKQAEREQAERARQAYLDAQRAAQAQAQQFAAQQAAQQYAAPRYTAPQYARPVQPTQPIQPAQPVQPTQPVQPASSVPESADTPEQ